MPYGQLPGNVEILISENFPHVVAFNRHSLKTIREKLSIYNIRITFKFIKWDSPQKPPLITAIPESRGDRYCLTLALSDDAVQYVRQNPGKFENIAVILHGCKSFQDIANVLLFTEFARISERHTYGSLYKDDQIPLDAKQEYHATGLVRTFKNDLFSGKSFPFVRLCHRSNF